MYSFEVLKNATTNPTVCGKMRCKGIQRPAQRLLKHGDYLAQLERPSENYIVNRRIGSKLHKLYTYESKKRGLCAFDDKRFLLEDGVTSLAFGHRDITARVHNDPRPDGTDAVVLADPAPVEDDEELLERLDGEDPVEQSLAHPLMSPPPESLGTASKRTATEEPPAHPASRPRYLPPTPEQVAASSRPLSTTHSRYLPPTPETIQLCSRQLSHSSLPSN